MLPPLPERVAIWMNITLNRWVPKTERLINSLKSGRYLNIFNNPLLPEPDWRTYL